MCVAGSAADCAMALCIVMMVPYAEVSTTRLAITAVHHSIHSLQRCCHILASTSSHHHAVGQRVAVVLNHPAHSRCEIWLNCLLPCVHGLLAHRLMRRPRLLQPSHKLACRKCTSHAGSALLASSSSMWQLCLGHAFPASAPCLGLAKLGMQQDKTKPADADVAIVVMFLQVGAVPGGAWSSAG